MLAMTTPGRSGATLDSKDPHRPNHRRLTGCHSYRSPDSAGRPAHAGAGRWSGCPAWTPEIPTSFVRSNCSGVVITGDPDEWVTEVAMNDAYASEPPVDRHASFQAR